MNNRIAYLAPEIPSVSGTFVYREILAVRATGTAVVPFAMRRTSPEAISEEGLPFLEETTIVYAGAARVAWGSLCHLLRHPLRSMRTLSVAARDFIAGTFARRSARWKVPVQAFAGLHLARLLRRHGVAHLHVHFAHAPATLGMYATLASDIPFSVTAHANDLFVESSLLREKLVRAQPFVTISVANQAMLHRRFGDLAAGVRIVRCGVDLEKFRPRDGGGTRRPVVVAVGRLVPKKGFDVLLDAVAQLRSRHPDIRVEILGDGPQRRELEEQRRALQLADCVTFHGAVDAHAIRSALANARLFALPSRSDADGDQDGIPVALAEAMASGLPCISSRISGIPELIEDGVSGLLVEPEDARLLARALDTVLSSDTLAARLGSTGRAVVAREFNQDRSARRLVNLIRGSGRSTDLLGSPLSPVTHPALGEPIA